MLLGFSGCSVKFAYNNVDRLVRWQISDYVDLNRAQKDRLNKDLDKLMSWHRSQHLPQYAVFTYGLAQTWTDGVSEQQIADFFEQALFWGDEIQAASLPLATSLLASLTDEQVKALPQKLEEQNFEIEEDEIDKPLQEIQSRWAEEFEDGVEQFTGRLGKEQRAYIARRSMAYQPETQLWAQYRRRWQADLLKLLEARQDESFAQRFDELVAARESYYGEAFVRVSDENIALSREMGSYLLSNLTDKQTGRFVEFLNDLAEDFEELAAQEQS